MSGLPFFPPQASDVAGQVDLLFIILVVLSGFFTSIVVALIFYFGIRYRRGNPVDRSNPPTTSLTIETGWVFGLLALGLGTYVAATIIYFNMYRPRPSELEIYVVGQQWMWKIQHPEGPSEINTLHVPVGRTARLIMISEDVIHSFFIPAFRLKFDVLPGRYTNLWFQPTQVGEYHVFCAEYCGTEHSNMIGTIVVLEPSAYQEWLSAGGGEEPATQSGEALFTQLGCNSCHVGGAGTLAPSLAGLFGSQVPLADGGTVTADENYIRESILLPQEKIHAGFEPIMPSYEGQVSEEQLFQLVDYIRTLGAGTGTDQP
jgi:cytochrome c oxidase subunit 2